MKLKRFRTVNDTIVRVKRQTSEQGKIFANYTSERELESIVYDELKKLNFKKTKSLIKNRAHNEAESSQKMKYKWLRNIF